MKTFLLTFLLFSCAWNISTAQETKLPLEMKSGHLHSQWIINDTIETKVFLETGFPKIVISETFAKKHLQSLIKMVEAPENTYIALWNNDNQKYKVSYLINDSLIINGKKIKIDALVTDFSTQKSWVSCDIIFPLFDLSGQTELNIKEKYMKVNYKNEYAPTDFIVYDVQTDSRTKGLYITTTLRIYDTSGEKEELTGNFLLDLGAGNAFFLNKNQSKVSTFVTQSDRMHLKDTTQFKPNPKTELSIIMPNRIEFDNIEIKGHFIAAMKIFASNQSNSYIGMIGNPFFANFIVIFDFDNNKLYLKPNSDKVKIVE